MYNQSRGGGGGGRGGGGGGRGEYYKNKYGGGGRGRGGRGRGGENDSGFNTTEASQNRPTSGGGSYAELRHMLQRLDGKSYPAYHDLDTPMDRGWVNSHSGFTLYVERAQSDPYAAPTRCRVVVDASRAGFPNELYANRERSIGLSDYLLRNLYNACRRLGADASMGGGGGDGGGWSGPKGGDLQVLAPCQHVLEQSAVRVDARGNVIAQLTINLPARGRTILGQAAEKILGHTLPTMVEQSLLYSALSAEQVRKHVECVEDQVWLQKQLELRNVVAFVRNGAILPRLSGADDRPMAASKAIPFESPERLEINFTLPNSGTTVTGMGIPKGITLICGGGFHGKSTLLETLQVGIHPKIPGDGREFCVTSADACKIRAEDGRSVQAVDISNFINNLPFQSDTTRFSSMDASGSTSQAANIVEAMECGTNVLLIDEDTCATNFMIRDDKMMQLVAPDKEPITPFVRTVRSLYDDCGVSSILVIGGTGDYFDVADNVFVMDSYKCCDATEKAKLIVANSKSSSASMGNTASQSVVFRRTKRKRAINGNTFSPNGKVKTLSECSISYGETELNLSCLEQVVSKAQTTAISHALQRLPQLVQQGQSIRDTLRRLDERIDKDGLDVLAPGQCNGSMARPRSYEIAGAINRLRRENIVTQE